MGLKRFLSETVAMPPKVFDSRVLNSLGVQVGRILKDEAVTRLTRPRRKSGEVGSLIENGFVILENFLPEATFARIAEEFDEAFRKDEEIRLRKTGPSLIRERDILASEPDVFPTIHEHIYRSDRLRGLIQSSWGKKVRLPPAAILQWLGTDDGTRNDRTVLHHSEDFDVETILHQDHCLAIYKAWYYLEDVGQENGAFIYAPGTQRVTLARLRYEYEKSSYFYQLKRGDFEGVPEENLLRKRFVPSPSQRQALGIQETPLSAPANSLVIANTVGFHRRGALNPGRTRKLVHLDFRRLQSPLNTIPGIGGLPVVERAILKNRRSEKYL